jgi:hypothetical protein
MFLTLPAEKRPVKLNDIFKRKTDLNESYLSVIYPRLSSLLKDEIDVLISNHWSGPIGCQIIVLNTIEQ